MHFGVQPRANEFVFSLSLSLPVWVTVKRSMKWGGEVKVVRRKDRGGGRRKGVHCPGAVGWWVGAEGQYPGTVRSPVGGWVEEGARGDAAWSSPVRSSPVRSGLVQPPGQRFSCNTWKGEVNGRRGLARSHCSSLNRVDIGLSVRAFPAAVAVAFQRRQELFWGRGRGRGV